MSEVAKIGPGESRGLELSVGSPVGDRVPSNQVSQKAQSVEVEGLGLDMGYMCSRQQLDLLCQVLAPAQTF